MNTASYLHNLLKENKFTPELFFFEIFGMDCKKNLN